MALADLLIIKLGASVAKALAKSLVGEGFAKEVLPELVGPFEDWFKDKAEARKAEKELAKVGQIVAEKMRLRLSTRFGQLEQSRKEAVVREAVTTLAKADITADLVIKFNLKEEELCNHLLSFRPHATKDFSTEEAALYREMLCEASRHILKVATQLTGFTGSAFSEVLEGQDKLLGLLEKVLGDEEEAAIRFEKRYRESVRDGMDRMDMFGVPRVDELQGRQSLTVSYITLQAEQYITGQPQEARDLSAEAWDGGAPPAPGSWERDEMRSGPIDHMLAKTRRLVIRGEAGSGKTTLLRWIAVRAASQDFKPLLASWNASVPFFLRLRESVEEGFPTTEEWLPLISPMLAAAVPNRWVLEQLDSGRALVLVDGVDELPRAQRGKMLERLDSLISAYPLARYVVSSRPTAVKTDEWPEWQEWIVKRGFTEVTLQRMEQTQMFGFIDNWYAAVRPFIPVAELDEFSKRPANLKALLRVRPALRKLAASPLLCAMICALHRDRGKNLPSERLTLYDDCCKMLLYLREDRRDIDLSADYPNLSDLQKQALIQGFAYWLMDNGLSDTETKEADAHFENNLQLMSLPGVTGAQVRRYLVERSNILREPVKGRVDFTHRTFQEFLAAREAVKRRNFGVLIRNAHDDQWRETIILAAGLASTLAGPQECERLLRGIIERGNQSQTFWERLLNRPVKPSSGRPRLQMLALACLETPVMLDPRVRQYVVEQAAPIFPPKNSGEAVAVAAAGDQAVPFLKAKPGRDWLVDMACVRALGLIGSDAALEALEEYAGSDSYTVESELGGAWDNFDRHEYARRILSKRPQLDLPAFSSWEGFEYLTNLTEINIDSFDFNQAGRLAALPNLASVRLSGSGSLIQDLTAVSSLKNISSLSLSSNNIFLELIKVKDLKPLATMTNLKALRLDHFPAVNDLSPLAALTELQTLTLDYFNSVSDLSPLSKLQQLEVLTLEHLSALTDIGTLADLNGLTHLTLGWLKITDLTALAGLNNLRILRIVYCPEIEDLRPLASLTGLEEFSIQGCKKVSDLSPLAAMKNLQRLMTLDMKPNLDLSPVRKIKGLKIFS